LSGVYTGDIAWTNPYRIEITSALKHGQNKLVIHVTNTWTNRLIGDLLMPESERIIWTTAPYRIKDKELLESGLTGPLSLIQQVN
jgi:hypothetical protein